MINYKSQLLNDFKVTDPVPLWTKGAECSSVLKSCFKGTCITFRFKNNHTHIYLQCLHWKLGIELVEENPLIAAFGFTHWAISEAKKILHRLIISLLFLFLKRIKSF